MISSQGFLPLSELFTKVVRFPKPFSQEMRTYKGILCHTIWTWLLPQREQPDFDIWGSPAESERVGRKMGRKTMDRYLGRWMSAFYGIWLFWPGASQIINAAQLLLMGHRSPLPLTLCTSERSSVAGRTRRSAPGCAGPQGGARRCISFPPQSAPGAHRCSSRRDQIRGIGKPQQMDRVPSSLQWKAAGPGAQLWDRAPPILGCVTLAKLLRLSEHCCSSHC